MGSDQVRSEQIRLWVSSSVTAKVKPSWVAHLPTCERCCHWFFDAAAYDDGTTLCPDGLVAYRAELL
jgi:hypothetical protein